MSSTILRVVQPYKKAPFAGAFLFYWREYDIFIQLFEI